MLYVWRASWKPGLSREQMDVALIRRAGWSYPEGINVIAEYWLSGSSPVFVSIFETEEYGPILELGLTWQGVFEISFIIEQLCLCLHSLPRDMSSGNADDDWASECDAPGDGGWTP